jgi:hypothetical protein
LTLTLTQVLLPLRQAAAVSVPLVVVFLQDPLFRMDDQSSTNGTVLSVKLKTPRRCHSGVSG